MKGFVFNAKKAIDKGSDSDSYLLLCFVLAEFGKIKEARRLADNAIASNPLSYMPPFLLACINDFDGDFNTALEMFNSIEKKYRPKEALIFWWHAQCAAFAGKNKRSLWFDHLTYYLILSF